MSDLFKPGQHPDADQLNAFVEHTLPAHEQEQTLAHLAGCSVCREIVSLSLLLLEAVPLVEVQPVEAEPAAKPSFGGWFSGWRFAWIGAPIFAAFAVLAIYLQNGSRDHRPVTSASQVAEVHPPLPPPDPPSRKGPPLADKSAAPAPLLARTRKPSASRHEHGADSLPLNGRESAVLNPPPGFGKVTSGSGSAPMAIGGLMGGVASAKRTASAQPTVEQTSQSIGGPAMRKASSLPSSLSTALSSPSCAPNAASMPGSATASSSPVANERAAAPTGQTHGFIGHSTVAKSGSISILAPLPSGQPILSFAASLHKLVVLDKQNTVFYSQDEGRHWKQVSAVWKGRAIEVARVAQPGALTPGAKSFALGVPERFKAGGVVSAQLSADPDSFGSSLSGTVTDASGAAVPGASVTVQENRYAVLRTERADDAGYYSFSDLAPGSYRIDVQAAGFQKQALVENLVPSQQALRNVILSVGQVSQTVTVDAASVQMETHSRTDAVSSDKVKTAEKTPSAKQNTALFVITAESGDRWTSADGLTWTHE